MKVSRYRIKIITYKSGSKKYYAQFKTKLMWVDIQYDGGLDFTMLHNDSRDRDSALEIIDKHYTGNTTKQTIEFEYITKTNKH